jgi:nucleoside-diphosphate-sugar epimerase
MVGSAIVRQLQQSAQHSALVPQHLVFRTHAFVMNLPKAVYDQHTSPVQSQINVGYGSDITIAQLAQFVSQAVGYQDNIDFDATQPATAPRASSWTVPA